MTVHALGFTVVEVYGAELGRILHLGVRLMKTADVRELVRPMVEHGAA